MNDYERYPDGFDASIGIPAKWMQEANSIGCDLKGDREWDVPVIASAMQIIAQEAAEAAVERYAAKVRAAITVVLEQEKAIRAQHQGESPEYWKADYAVWTCHEIKGHLLQIK